MTDVNISVELMTDASQDLFDVALLISADNDWGGPVEAVQRLFPAKRVVVVFPSGRSSFAPIQTAKAVLHISHVELAKAEHHLSESFSILPTNLGTGTTKNIN